MEDKKSNGKSAICDIRRQSCVIMEKHGVVEEYNVSPPTLMKRQAAIVVSVRREVETYSSWEKSTHNFCFVHCCLVKADVISLEKDIISSNFTLYRR